MSRRVLLSEIVDGLATRASIPNRFAEDFVQAFFNVIEENLVREKLVKVKGLGTFKLIDVEARESIHVSTGERILLAGHTKVSFTPDPVLRDAVNRPFADFETVVLNEATPTELMERIDEVQVPEADEAAIPEVDIVSKVASVEENLRDEETNDVVEAAPEVETTPEREVAPEVETSVPVEEVTPSEVISDEHEIVVEELPKTEKTSEDVETIVEEAHVAEEPVVEGSSVKEETVVEEQTAEEQSTEDSPVEKQATEKQPIEEPTSTVSADTASPLVSTPKHRENYYLNETQEETHMTRNILLGLLGALLCMFLGYAICFYFRPFELPTLSPAPQSQRQFVPASSSDESAIEAEDGAKPAELAEPAEVTGDKAANSDAADAASASASAEKAVVAQPTTATSYPQLEGGDYQIVGVKGTEVMKPGKTLLNISLKYYQSTDFVPYICKMNGIDNPDVVPLDMELKIPELKKK